MTPAHPPRPALRIYDASAGSGKTYTLVLDYLLKALAAPLSPQGTLTAWSPLQFTAILALTFTRKATAQMKERILQELTALATPGEESALLATLQQELQLPQETIIQRARLLLINLLDQYEAMAISTIDSFVQRMAQAVLWELGYPGHLSISLNQTFYFNRAAERLLADLTPGSALYEWMQAYQSEQLTQEASWRIISQLTALGQRLFASEYLLLPSERRRELFSTEFAKITGQQLDLGIQQLALRIHRQAKSLNGLVAVNDIPTISFAYGAKGQSGWELAINPFLDPPPYNAKTLRLPKRALAMLEPGKPWIAQTLLRTPEGKSLQTRIDRQLREPFQTYMQSLQSAIVGLRTLQAVREELPALALLSHLREALSRVERENAEVLLPDLAALLLALSRPEDAPFIYERIGTRYLHLAIDEFQDTSQVQWALLKPFIENALSMGHSPLLVGDMKQAIYRWRGGS